MLTFVGDVFLRTAVAIEVPLPGRIVLNLEAPLTDRSVGYPRKINLKAPAENYASVFGSRPTVANLANNHVMDFFEPGLEDTLAALDDLGVPRFGLMRPTGEYLNPAIIDVDGTLCALLGYADKSCTPVFGSDSHSGAVELTLERLRDDIATARARGAQRVVANVHWGEEQVSLPSPRCVELAHAIVEAGVDLVIGHHAHCIQSFEVYEGKHVFYGLGNFIFPGHQSPSYFTDEGVATRTTNSIPAQRNRRSLAVTWAPATEQVSVQPVYFTDVSVVPGSFDVDRFRLVVGPGEDYEQRYRRAYNWGKLQHSFERFRRDPKLPGLRHVRGIGRLMRTPPRT